MHADEFVLGIAEEEEEEEEDFRVGGWDCPKWSRCVSPLMDPLLQLGRRMRTNVFAAREHSERWRDVRVQEIDADEDRPRRRPEYIPVAHCK